MEKSNKLFSNLKPGDTLYHLIFKSDGSKWILERCNKLTVMSTEIDDNEFKKELIMHCAISNIKLPDYICNVDTYGIDDCDLDKSICTWFSGSETLCMFSTSEPICVSDEIKKILTSYNPVCLDDTEEDADNEDDF